VGPWPRLARSAIWIRSCSERILGEMFGPTPGVGGRSGLVFWFPFVGWC